jgi:hypothetical protein
MAIIVRDSEVSLGFAMIRTGVVEWCIGISAVGSDGSDATKDDSRTQAVASVTNTIYVYWNPQLCIHNHDSRTQIVANVTNEDGRYLFAPIIPAPSLE